MATPSANASVTPTATVTALPNVSSNVQVFPNTFQGPKGDKGDIGPIGPRGPAGVGGGGNSAKQEFSTPSKTWTVVHDLNAYPSIDVIDTAGDLIEPDIKYVDENTVLVTFSAPTAGTVLIN